MVGGRASASSRHGFRKAAEGRAREGTHYAHWLARDIGRGTISAPVRPGGRPYRGAGRGARKAVRLVAKRPIVCRRMALRLLRGDRCCGRPVAAADDFPLAGNYTQNVACKGDGTDAALGQGRRSRRRRSFPMSASAPSWTRKRTATAICAHVECKFAGGPLIGDITFTPRPTTPSGSSIATATTRRCSIVVRNRATVAAAFPGPA